MGAFVRTWDRITSGVLDFMGFIYGVEKGDFCVNFGQHEIVVPLQHCASNVWVSLTQGGPTSCGTCGGCSINKIGYTLLDDYLVFYVDVRTDHCDVRWVAYR